MSPLRSSSTPTDHAKENEGPASTSRGLVSRFLSAAIGIPIIVASVLIGRTSFFLLVSAVMVVALSEFYSMVEKGDLRPNTGLGIFGGLAVGFGAFFGGPGGIVAMLAVVIALCLVWLLSRPGRVCDVGATLVGVAYCGLFLSFFILSYDLPRGPVLVLVIFIATWVSDTSAYGFGALAGKQKLAERISPNKTVAGALAGLAAPALVLGIAGLFPEVWLGSGTAGLFGALKGAVLGGTIGVAAPIGDLVESRMKREFGVKDSGRMIPGHGGVLDRIDSLLFVVVAAYYLWQVLLV